MDILLFLVEDSLQTGQVRRFSIRVLARRTGHSERQVSKVVRQLQEQQLVNLSSNPQPGISLKAYLEVNAVLNQTLMSLFLGSPEKVTVHVIPDSAQEQVETLQRQNKAIKQLNVRYREIAREVVRQQAFDFLFESLDSAHLANDVAHEFQKKLPTLRGQDDTTLAKLLEDLLENTLTRELRDIIPLTLRE